MDYLIRSLILLPLWRTEFNIFKLVSKDIYIIICIWKTFLFLRYFVAEKKYWIRIMAFKDVLFEKQNQLDGCFRKRKQSCVPHMSLDGNNWLFT